MIKKAIISGGGTGGHIYPAIAIADEIKRRYPDVEILFVGASDRMEMQKVPAAGYKIKGLWIAGLQRSFSAKNLLFPVKLLFSLIKAYFIVLKFKPDIAVGTGGYASGPTLFVANKRKIPTLIQEQNSYPGITNKLLGRTVEKIAVAYDNMQRFFPEAKIIKTGNPVRSDLLNLKSPQESDYLSFRMKSDKPILLVLGGSLGARSINQLIDTNLNWILQQGIQVLWQTGAYYFDQYKIRSCEGVEVMAYINDMPKVYSMADYIISRAGASSVSELCLVAKPTLFIPSPNVAEDHQTKNAQSVVEKNAAIMLSEKEINSFQEKFNAWIGDKQQSEQMSIELKNLALPNATVEIVDQIEKLL
ncbi:MAG: undecaprenyldiphospho-muramoylpentapeptide beta-N-acetylglucosaminyltransferase [Flavobacteriaceae bacterium]